MIFDYEFYEWVFDGVQIGADNPVTIGPEEVGTSHSLVAVFRWRQSNQLPPRQVRSDGCYRWWLNNSPKHN